MDIDVNELLASVPSEGKEEAQAEMAQEEKETPSESPTEETKTEKSPTSEGDNTQDETNLPFHKHPRWKAMYEENKRLKEAAEVKPEQAKPEGTLPDRFVKLYGDNPEAWKLYQEEQSDFKRQVIQELKQEQQREADAEKKRLSEAQDNIETQFDELTSEGVKVEKNALLKFMFDFKEEYGAFPSDAAGDISLKKGFALMQKMGLDNSKKDQEKSKARKELASFTSSGKGKATSHDDEVMTPAKLRNLSWEELIRT